MANKLLVHDPNMTNMSDYSSYEQDEQRKNGYAASQIVSSKNFNSALHQTSKICFSLVNALIASSSYSKDIDLKTSTADITKFFTDSLKTVKVSNAEVAEVADVASKTDKSLKFVIINTSTENTTTFDGSIERTVTFYAPQILPERDAILMSDVANSRVKWVHCLGSPATGYLTFNTVGTHTKIIDTVDYGKYFLATVIINNAGKFHQTTQIVYALPDVKIDILFNETSNVVCWFDVTRRTSGGYGINLNAYVSSMASNSTIAVSATLQQINLF